MNHQPSKRTWTQVATEEALAAGVDPVAVMAGVMRPGLAPTRWRAWRRLANAPQGYSLAGIGRTSGFHHTSIMYGLRRLDGLSHDEAKRASLAVYRED